MARLPAEIKAAILKVSTHDLHTLLALSSTTHQFRVLYKRDEEVLLNSVLGATTGRRQVSLLLRFVTTPIRATLADRLAALDRASPTLPVSVEIAKKALGFRVVLENFLRMFLEKIEMHLSNAEYYTNRLSGEEGLTAWLLFFYKERLHNRDPVAGQSLESIQEVWYTVNKHVGDLSVPLCGSAGFLRANSDAINAHFRTSTNHLPHFEMPNLAYWELGRSLNQRCFWILAISADMPFH